MTEPLRDRIEATARMLEAACRERRVTITGDRRISEDDAAALLCIAPGHLKALRQEGKGPTPYVRGMNGFRVSYRIDDVACWIEAARQGW